jgi:GT2 family glycosyltransferase
MVRREFQDVALLQGDGNLWWTGAINLGINFALQNSRDGDYIILLNDDLVVDSDYISNFLSAAHIKPNSIIGSVEVIEDAPNIITSGGVLVNWRNAKIRVLNRGKRLDSFPGDHLEPVSILPGRGTLYPVSVFKKVGLFDDRHFQQCGDIELPRRAFLSGYELFVYYGAVVKTVVDNVNTENINSKASYSLKDFTRYFFDIRSNFRIRYRYSFSRSSSANPFSSFTYFLCDMTRVTSHFISRLSFR